ncbi:GerMN domain-containing protein [Marinilactibacillus sp. Marseille-P9653]|uniref:GerMN domain-containing protein n=1 Tax=Marinilactibacillus sp. Marseille-P9653 TaxID=2866583 RepID=UPI001CE44ECD|nr:GerMN domain-containing protein [Marinilactibacillus sp. Marseille-P9653]
MNQPITFKTVAVLTLSGFLLAACEPAQEQEAVDPDPTETVTVPEPGEADTDTDTEETADETDTLSQNMLDWLPMNEDTAYTYSGTGSEFAEYQSYPQFIHNDTLQFVETNASTETVKIYEYTENEVREVFTRAETYFRDDFVDTGLNSSEQDQLEILLQAPVEIGRSWDSPSGSVSEITDANVEVETPAGTYSALEITRTLNDQSDKLYYAKGTGLIQTISDVDGETEIISSLSNIQEDAAEEIPLTLYELNEMATALTTTNATMELRTNDPARLQLTEMLNGSTGDMTIPTLTENVQINYLYLGNDQIAHVDFSEELINDMNAGSGIEALLIQSLVNTIGGLYQVDEVLLTVEDAPYASGHIAMEEGQTMSVDLSSVE